MCGIIAVKGKIENNKLKSLLNEAQIRGKHATGIARWNFQSNSIQAIIEPIPSKVFTEKYNKELDIWCRDDLILIGHTRYSTSDLRYNQPIFDNSLALAHNGVVTQESPDKWVYKCETSNDTELLFRYIKEHSNLDNVEEKFQDLSYAAVWIEKGELKAQRNGLRPLWVYRDNKVEIYASTKDILERSGFMNAEPLKSTGIDFQE